MLDHLKGLAKEYNINCSYMNKDELIGMLLDKQIITTTELRNPMEVGHKKDTVKLDVGSNKYAYLKTIRTNPKAVEIYDRETGQTSVYPSHTRTVVRECCKGDDASQWENGKFDPLPPRTH